MLHYAVYGAGSQTVVLLHGYLSSSAYWSSLIPVLSKNYRVIAIDLLGFGASPKPKDGDYSPQSHARAVRAAVRRTTTKPIRIIGHSMGALIAAEYARLWPDDTERLVLCNMPIYVSPVQAERELAATSLLYRYALFSRLGSVIWPLTRLIPTAHMAAFASIYDHRHTKWSRAASLKNTILAANGLQLLADLTVPALLLEGLRDRTIYRTNLENFRPSRNVTIAWHDGDHHMLYDPAVRDSLHNDIQFFLEGLSRS